MNTVTLSNFGGQIETWRDATDCLWRSAIIALVMCNFSPVPGKVFATYHPMCWRITFGKNTATQRDGDRPFDHSTEEVVRSAITELAVGMMTAVAAELQQERRAYYATLEMPTQITEQMFIDHRRGRKRGWDHAHAKKYQ